MADRKIGPTLKARREQLGLSIDQVSRKTNIRARVLETFESGDISAYPQKGYATGMLSSYARTLGLDPRDILKGYEDELKQESRRSQNASDALANMEGHSKTRRSRRTRTVDSDSLSTTSSIKVIARSSRRSQQSTAGESSSSGRLSSASTSRSSRTSAARSSAASMTGRLSSLDLDEMMPQSSEDSSDDDYTVRGGKRYKPQSRVESSRSRSRSRRSYTPAPDEGLFTTLKNRVIEIASDTHSRMLAIAAILLIVALLIVASFLLSSAGNKDAGILSVEGGANGSSVTTTTTDESGTATATVTTSNGNPIVVTVEVEEGSTSLINITYDDDSAYNGTAVGPWSREFQVTESLVAKFGTPSAVTVTCNGDVIDIPVASDGTGTLSLTVQASGLAAGGTSSTDQEQSQQEQESDQSAEQEA